MIAPFAVYPKGTVPVRMLPIAKALRRRGYDVSIVVPPYDNPAESGREYEVDGVKVYNVRFRDVPLLKYPLTAFRILWKVFRLKPQVVYVFKPKGYSGLAAMLLSFMRMLGLLRGLRLVLDMDDWEGYGGFCDYYLKHSLYPKYMLDFFDFQERWIPRRVDAITVASRTLQRRVMGWGIPAAKVFYVPNGVEARSSYPSSCEVGELKKRLGLEDSKVILLYTRFFEYRIEKVIEILKLVRKELGNVKLLVVGKGEFGEEQKLMGLAAKEGAEGSIVLAGWVQPSKIPTYLATGDVAIYPFDDTLLNRAKCPGKLIELMVAGKAIIAERVGQIAEYIEDGKSGLLVDPDDVLSFSSAINMVLRDDELRRRLSENARKRITNVFNWNKLLKNVELAVNLTDSNLSLRKQEQLELKIKRLLESGASFDKLKKAYDEFHLHLLNHGIRGRYPQGYLYRKRLSLIERLFLQKIGTGKTVLEIGVGDGHFLIACARKGNSVIGVDISTVVIRRLKPIVKREGLNIELKLGDARCLEFPNEIFDFVVSKDLIEHIPEQDLQLHLREVWRVLKRNGCYLIWTPSKLLGSTSLGTHLKEYLLAELFCETMKAGFKPNVMNLHAYILSKTVQYIPHKYLTALIKYETFLARFLKRLNKRVQHPLFYIIVPPLCIAANKKDVGS